MLLAPIDLADGECNAGNPLPSSPVRLALPALSDFGDGCTQRRRVKMRRLLDLAIRSLL